MEPTSDTYPTSRDIRGTEPLPGLARSIRVSKARVVFVFLTCLYIAIFAWTYLVYTQDTYAYLGFGERSSEGVQVTLRYWLLLLLPSFFLPLSLDRPSGLFLLIQYFLIYVPSQWMITHATMPALDAYQQTELSLMLLVGMLIMTWAQSRWRLLRVPRIRVSQWIPWLLIYLSTVGALLLLVALFGTSPNFVGLADIYFVREEATDVLEASGSSAGGYAFAWLNSFFLPLIFARAILRSNWWLLGGVIAAYAYLYGIWGSKASLLAPVILLAMSVFAAQPARRLPWLFASGLIALLLVPFALPFSEGIGAIIKQGWVGIVHMRTFAIPGLILVQYSGFFAEHPLTFGSHITGLNQLMQYPFDYDLPRTVGYHYYERLVTVNGNFWAQDGIAGFGLMGIIVMSAVAGAILWLLDSVTRHLPRRFVLPALAGSLMTFTNVPLFTTLLTGGLGFFMLSSMFLQDPSRPNRIVGR